MKSVFLFLFIFFGLLDSYCQYINYSFGDVTREELLMQDCAFEPGAPAMLIAEKCGVVNNIQEPYSSVSIQRRIKVLTSEGFSYGNFEIEFNHKISELEISRAMVYNLVDDKVVMEKITAKNYLITKIDKSNLRYTLTLPNVKVGSVIDIFYKLSAHRSMNLEPWYFQSEIPCGWSEYKTVLHKKESYNYYYTEYLPFTVNTIMDPSQLDDKQAGYVINRFVVENAPSYQLLESFVLRPHDQVSKVEPVYIAFNQNSIWGYSEGPMTWSDISNDLNKHPRLGRLIYRSKILNTELGIAAKDCHNFEDSLRTVYEFVRQNVKCNGLMGIYGSDPVETWTSKTGNTGDINILLLAALQSAGFDCHPVLLTTIREAPPSKTDPRHNRINFLVAAVFSDTCFYLLDASDRDIAFNTLPEFCLNGEGFLISNHPHEQWLPLLRTERYESQTEVTLDWSTDKKAKGNVVIRSYSLYANKFRGIIRDNGEEEYIKSRLEDFSNYNISAPAYTGLNETDSAFVERFAYSINADEYNTTESYFLPVMPFAPFRENPFDAIKRDFRIDFIAPMLRKTDVTINIPEGYGIVHFPESITVDNLNNDFSFDFSIEVSPDQRVITVQSDVRINRYSYSKDEYGILRQFFTEIVKMQNSLIELKKL
jgi:hypothetical protein